MSFTKVQHKIAKDKKKALFAAEINGKYAKGDTGVYRHFGPVNIDDARMVFFFSLYVCQNKMDWDVAFAKAEELVNGNPHEPKPEPEAPDEVWPVSTRAQRRDCDHQMIRVFDVPSWRYRCVKCGGCSR